MVSSSHIFNRCCVLLISGSRQSLKFAGHHRQFSKTQTKPSRTRKDTMWATDKRKAASASQYTFVASDKEGKRQNLPSSTKSTMWATDKRKAPSVSAYTFEAPVKREKEVTRADGWIRDQVPAQRRVERDLKFNEKRLRFLTSSRKIKPGSEGVLYWMSRDQRVQDNWALIYAQKLAVAERLPLHICFCLEVPQSDFSTLRHFGFLLRGLEDVAKECSSLDIQFHLLHGPAGEVLPPFADDHRLGAVVTDFSSLRTPRQRLEDVKKRLQEDIPIIQVDAHNVVPVWVTSHQEETRAYIIRPKITKHLPEFLTDFPPVVKHPHTASRRAEPVDWAGTLASLQLDRTVKEVDWATPGATGGMDMLESFIDQRLKNYATLRNDPTRPDAISQLSPWIRFGHLSAQRVAMQAKRCAGDDVAWLPKDDDQSITKFIDELIVWREMTENFVFYNNNYDSFQGAEEWAQRTLKEHTKDPRQYVYTREQFEKCMTHDKLWNAAQYQMVTEGKMHGFLRMYWAKKILEWTSSPEEALAIALYLNDRYELDGQDANGFGGCMWAICGVHDRDFAERPIYGKIRTMTYHGCLRKFDVAQFEKKYSPKYL